MAHTSDLWRLLVKHDTQRKHQRLEADYNHFSVFARYRLFNSPILNVSLIDGNAMLPSIHRIGDQLNQITYTVNLTGTVSKEQVVAVKELVGQLSKGFWCKFSSLT
ncbi:MAG: hypothetical protein ACLR2N_13890 [Lacticaseibacillus rhamnosus]